MAVFSHKECEAPLAAGGHTLVLISARPAFIFLA